MVPKLPLPIKTHILQKQELRVIWIAVSRGDDNKPTAYLEAKLRIICNVLVKYGFYSKINILKPNDIYIYIYIYIYVAPQR